MSTEIRIALVFQQDEGTQILRTALANAGVIVAVESRASALDPGAIFASDVDAIVVNLDAELEELLDEVTDALDSARQPVIYNDPAASSDLSGWDRARWLRHLAAKLKGQTNVTPPPPPGAQAIPMPPAKPVEAAVMAVAPAELPTTPEAAPSSTSPTPAAAESAAEIPFDLGLADLDRMFDAPALAHAGTEAEVRSLAAEAGRSAAHSDAVPDGMFELGLAEIDLMFEPAEAAPPAIGTGANEMATPVAAPEASADLGLADLDAMFETALDDTPSEEAPKPQSLTVGEDIGDLDALFSEAPDAGFGSHSPQETTTAGAASASVEFELESLFSEPDHSAATPLVAPAASSTELNDLDALFREFEASQAASVPAAAPGLAGRASSPEPASPAPAVELKGLSLDWSLAPVEDEASKAAPPGDRMVAEWRLDAPSKPIAPVVAKAAPPPPVAKMGGGPSIPAELEASLALSNLQLVDDSEGGDSVSEQIDVDALAELESLHLSSLDAGSNAPTGSSPTLDFGNDLGLADLDFDLDLGSNDLSTPALDAPTSDNDADLGDLDSLFEPMVEVGSRGLALADLNRVFVLGASIGGPEAIKAFLAKLPPSVPAAFIVAQHMGAEFLEMMATQLNAASALAVRTPKAGERLRHGEVIVAPANEQLTIDESGQVSLSAASSGSPYNPSIDQLARDAANRFGDHATLILFSGMGTDAVEGARYLAARGGEVWAQDRGSCVIASMIDSAKSQGLVRFEGTPVQLAERVLQVVS